MELGRLIDWAQEEGLFFDEDRLWTLAGFLKRIYEVNEVMNLTRVPQDEAVVRHVIDSLLPHHEFPDEGRVLDIGTGPGFPAWPIAWMRPDLHVVGLDGSSKPFGPAADHPLPNLEMRQGRAEEVSEPEAYDLVVGRAVAPLGLQLEASAAWARIGGVVLPSRSATEAEEIEAFPAAMLGLRLETIVTRRLPDGAPRLFPRFRKVKETPEQFPRPWGRMKAKPLRSAVREDA